MRQLSYFSASMSEADSKFAKACDARGVALRRFEHPLAGPSGEPLCTSTCRIGRADAHDVLVMISATHGIEGYCGAAIQTGILDVLPELELPESLAIVIVHMINPWGCAWDRRENEGNVDVFRNFLYTNPPYAANLPYDEIADALCPAEWSGPLREAADRKLQEFESLDGPGSVVAAARRGQHNHPRGLTYHGQGATWSKQIMDSIVSAELSSARRILNFDLHTGYGEYGDGVVVCFEPEGTRTSNRLGHWFGSNLLRPGSDPVIPAHPGSPYDMVCRGLAADTTSFALEFGTSEVIELFDLLREASWVFNYGNPLSEHGRAVRHSYRALFYPEHDDWKAAIWTRGREVTEQAIAAFREPWS